MDLSTLLNTPAGPDFREWSLRARHLTDRFKGRTVTFSPKVFIPLTRLCRDFCSYCTYRLDPGQAEQIFLSPDEVLKIARAGQRAGCSEALFVLGERPEQRYPEARDWLKRRGFGSSIEYLRSVCQLVLLETALFPHSNPGTLTRSELASLKEVNASMGLMLECASTRLCAPGGPHEFAPSKHPRARLQTLQRAGELKIPFTTGILAGIGETRRERLESLQRIRQLHDRYGHIQEVIIQNFRPQPETAMASAPEVLLEEMLETIAAARLVLGGEMNLQAPPNLAPASKNGQSPSYLRYLEAGINDWGGISPVTIDHVNPGSPWPHLHRFRAGVESRGYRLRARFPVYPEYFLNSSNYLNNGIRGRLRHLSDAEGYPRSVVGLGKRTGAFELEKGSSRAAGSVQ